MKRIVVCAILAPPLLFVIQAVTATLLLPPMPTLEGSAGPIALSVLMTALVLTTLAVTLAPRGWLRTAILFLVAAGIPANNLLEAVFFSLDIPRAHLGPLFLHTLASGALFAVVLDRLAGATARPVPSAAPRTALAWTLRLASCDVTYIVFYFTAGLVVWPYVSHFYAGRPLPDGQDVVLMQVFRGLVFSGIVLALARHLALAPVAGSLLIGLTLALLGGVAPLIIPNPYMPSSIRFPHMIEIVVSNFFFGLVAATLLRSPRAPVAVGTRAAA